MKKEVNGAFSSAIIKLVSNFHPTINDNAIMQMRWEDPRTSSSQVNNNRKEVEKKKVETIEGRK
jgi:hypothetical protein